ncbi:MAG: BMP family ABC transporter substrate-binding protein, partial [Methanomicrobiales archaeon]|nr:BMP family ABC transporter substrate-binding protein [Methanomicrobiales archaeon]
LREGATGIVYNPAFGHYNRTISSYETEAGLQEAQYLASRAPVS